jgi:hypothetical protein
MLLLHLESSYSPFDTTTGGILSPNPPSPVWTIVVLTPSTLGSGSIPSSAATTAPFTQSAMGPPFSYGMPDFDSNSFLTYSTLQTMGMGVGSSNYPMQGSTKGTSVPFNSIPYGGGHIPPPSPLIGGAFQQPIGPNANYNLFGAGSLGPSSYTTRVGSMSFSLFDVFGNNTFSSTAISTGGNPGFGNKILCRVLFLHRGKVHEFSPHKDFGILGKDQFPCKGCRLGETPSMVNGTPGRAQYLCPSDQLGESPSKILGTQHREKSPPNPCRPIMGVSR